VVQKERFWDIIAAYNKGIWPVQLGLYIAAIVIILWLFVRPGGIRLILAKFYCIVCFGWNGIVFYMLLGKDIAGGSYGCYFLGSLFIIVSLLFVVDVFKKKMQFSLPADKWRKRITLALVFFILCYPLLGLAFGNAYQRLIFPGTFPCPTIALALMLLTTALPRVDKIIYISLLFCAVPFTPFLQILRYGVYEDVVLFATGVYSLILLVRYWKPNAVIDHKE
jgi:hypothetical protein